MDRVTKRLTELLKRLETTPDVVRLSSFRPEILGDCTVGDLRQSLSQEAVREITDEEIRAIAEREVNPAYDENTQIITYVTRVVRAVLALSALSQEAVRDEVLEEAKEAAKAAHWHAHEPLPSCLASIEALKREPNAAALGPSVTYRVEGDPMNPTVTRVPDAAPDVLEVETEFRLGKSGPKYEFEIDGGWPVKPAPAACPDPQACKLANRCLSEPPCYKFEAMTAPVAPDVAIMVKRLRAQQYVGDTGDEVVDTMLRNLSALYQEAAALLAQLGQQVETHKESEHPSNYEFPPAPGASDD